MPSEMRDDEFLREAWEVRSRDLVEARVGLAQAVAALTDELEVRRREAEAASAEIAALREHTERDRAALQLRHAEMQEQNAAMQELAARLQRAQTELELLRGRRATRYIAWAQRLLNGLRARGR